MATDASRRWLDQGILSCRIKLPQPASDVSRPATTSNSKTTNNNDGAVAREAAHHAGGPSSPQGTMMDHLSLETTSPRRKDKFAETMHSIAGLSDMDSLELPTDPDAQATVTDFLDFTEYLPSDMVRSLTLIGNLDQNYHKAFSNVDALTKLYGDLPKLPADAKPHPVQLRSEISVNLADALSARTLSYAEAQRMADNVDRHYNRAKNILAKLQAMSDNYPPTREASPVAEKGKSPVASRVPRITLRIGTDSAVPKVRKHRAPRITVPGEVLAPYELNYESYGSDSDSWDSDEALTPGQTPARSIGGIKLKIPIVPRSKQPKPARTPRPPGAPGTNVHSQVAGISTSNALAMLKPPPPDAEKGSEDAPWLQLTDWELGMLRKRMKKNAVWSPSDTMIARELKNRGRGIEAYRSAKSIADAAGLPMKYDTPPQLLGINVEAPGAISVEAVKADQEPPNRGDKLNEARKVKRDKDAKELAKLAAEEAEQSALKMAEAAKAMRGLFSRPDEKKAQAKTPSKPPSNNKRKRDSVAEIETEKAADGGVVTVKPPEKSERPGSKRAKTETHIPAPPPLKTKEKAITPIEPPEHASAAGSVGPSLVTDLPSSAVEPPSSKPSTPILPPGMESHRRNAKREVKKEPAKEVQAEPPKEVAKEVKKDEKPPVEATPNVRTRRSSVAAAAAATKTPTPAPEVPSSKRPTSSRGQGGQFERPTSSRSAAGPFESSATIDRPRRASTTRNTPGPTPTESRPPATSSKRAKRPVPGVVTATSEGSAVSVGKRSSATSKKKTGTKKEKKDGREGSTVQEIFDEIDDQGNIIDPSEPRYCVCNRVSFGTMIGCENNECVQEWFHIECVGLSEIPPRTTKWYCPDCRVSLNIGEKGEVSARGKKK